MGGGVGGTPDYNTPFAVRNEKIHNHLPETATNCAKIQLLAQKKNISTYIRFNYDFCI